MVTDRANVTKAIAYDVACELSIIISRADLKDNLAVETVCRQIFWLFRILPSAHVTSRTCSVNILALTERECNALHFAQQIVENNWQLLSTDAYELKW